MKCIEITHSEWIWAQVDRVAYMARGVQANAACKQYTNGVLENIILTGSSNQSFTQATQYSSAFYTIFISHSLAFIFSRSRRNSQLYHRVQSLRSQVDQFHTHLRL